LQRDRGEAVMSLESNVQTVFKYYDACNSGDLDILISTFAPDVIHYFLPEIHKPIRGAEHLARYWRKFQHIYKPIWRIDHTLAMDEEVVIEWSCAYVPRGNEHRMMFRGSEWFEMRSGLIAEVRAYYQYDETRDCELTGFPYRERGYLSKGQ
jgi:ketosteroid isomerase-like protein